MDNTTIASILIALLLLFFKSVIKAPTSISLIWTGIFYMVIVFLYYIFIAKETAGISVPLNLVLGFILIIIGMVLYGTKNVVNKLGQK